MATIRPNDNAPAGEVKYILPAATFDLAEGGSYESDDRTVLADAEAHPWLTVEYPEAVEVDYSRAERSVPYEDDVLAAVNSQAFDPDKIREVEESKVAAVSAPTAIDAGLDQGDPGESGDGRVSTTLSSSEEATEAAEEATPAAEEAPADDPVAAPASTPASSFFQKNDQEG